MLSDGRFEVRRLSRAVNAWGAKLLGVRGGAAVDVQRASRRVVGDSDDDGYRAVGFGALAVLLDGSLVCGDGGSP